MSDSRTLKPAIDDLVTREIAPSDAATIAKLSEELGYPAAAAEMKKRIESLAEFTDHVVYVACLAGDLVGWIHVSVTRHLQAETRAEIGGLVVSTEMRGCGIGRRLVARAEHWAVQKGLKVMVVRSNVTREGAHRFYLKEGYTQTKTSAVFTKELV